METDAKIPRRLRLKQKLEEAMRGNGMNMEELHRRSGVPKSVLHRYLKGTATRPDAFSLIKLSKVLNLGLDTMLGTFDDEVEICPDELAIAGN